MTGKALMGMTRVDEFYKLMWIMDVGIFWGFFWGGIVSKWLRLEGWGVYEEDMKWLRVFKDTCEYNSLIQNC